MKVVMYGATTCSKCHVLRAKMDQAGITYEYIDDISTIKSSVPKGWMTVPILNVDGKWYQFAEAVKWVNEKGNNA